MKFSSDFFNGRLLKLYSSTIFILFAKNFAKSIASKLFYLKILISFLVKITSYKSMSMVKISALFGLYQVNNFFNSCSQNSKGNSQ